MWEKRRSAKQEAIYLYHLGGVALATGILWQFMEKKWYKVTFYACMTEEDIKAMKGCFYEAMNEAMAIDNCSGLDIELDEEENI